MGVYRVVLSRAVEHDMRKIGSKQIERIMHAIRSLTETPFPSGCKKLKDAHSSYRIRVGDYRIVYEVDLEEKRITVFYVRHRKDVYRL